MARIRKTAEGLTLKQVAALLGVSARRVQYVREIGIVQPVEVGVGRGHFCRYSEADIKWLYLVLIELEDVDYRVSRKIVEAAKETSKGKLVARLGESIFLHVDLAKLETEMDEVWARPANPLLD